MMDFNFRFGAEMKAGIERPLEIGAHFTDNPSVSEDGILISPEVLEKFAPKHFDPTGPSSEDVLKMLRED